MPQQIPDQSGIPVPWFYHLADLVIPAFATSFLVGVVGAVKWILHLRDEAREGNRVLKLLVEENTVRKAENAEMKSDLAQIRSQLSRLEGYLESHSKD